jgi:hypothetical protein
MRELMQAEHALQTLDFATIVTLTLISSGLVEG